MDLELVKLSELVAMGFKVQFSVAQHDQDILVVSYISLLVVQDMIE